MEPNNNKSYVSNPFLVTTDGLVLILKNNPVPALLVTIYMVLLLMLVWIVGLALTAVVPVVGILLLVLGSLVTVSIFSGMTYIIAGASADNKQVSLNSSFEKALGRLLPFIGLCLLGMLAVLVGLVFFILPGFYILARIALAPVVFFEENLGAVDSIKRSFALTKGHVWEVLSALLAGQLLGGGSGGLLSVPASIAPLTGRYRGLVGLKKSGAAKPAVHWLNYFLPVLAILFGLLYAGLVALSVDDWDKETGKKNNSSNKSIYDFQNDYDSPSLQEN